MDLLTSIVFLASAALPQEPAAPLTARHAERLPGHTVAVISVAPWEQSRDSFRAAGLDRIVADQEHGPTAIWRAVVTRWIGVDAEELTRLGSLGQDGFAVAFVGPEAGAPPGVVVLLDTAPETAAAFRSALSRRAEADQRIRTVDLGGVAAFETDVGTLSVTIAVQDDLVVLGSSRAAAAAVTGLATPWHGATLADSPRFVSFLEAAATDQGATPLVSLFVDAEALTSLALAEIPRAQRDVAGGWIDDLGLTGVRSLGLTIAVAGSEVTESVIVVCPEPRSALLTALMPSVPAIEDDVVQLIPADVASFGVGHVHWRDAFRAILDVVGRQHPAGAEQAQAMLEAVGAQLGGIDIERDFLAALGTRMVSMQWDASGSVTGDSIVLIELTDAGRAAKTLARLPFLTSSPLAGYVMFLAEREEQGALAIGDDTLVVASSERRLRRWIGGRKITTAHAEVQRMLADLPVGANGFGWIDLRGLSDNLTALLDATPVPVPGAELAQQVATETLAGISVMQWTTTVDERGFAFAARSPSGTITRAAAVLADLLTSEFAQQPAIAVIVDRAELADRNRGARVIAALEAIRKAQEDHQQQHGTFASLERLSAEELLPADLIARDPDAEVGVVDETLITVLIDADGASYAAVAWPNELRTGPVFACDQQTPPQRNDLVAYESGLARPELPDLFVGGVFGDGWTPGWRVATDRGEAAVSVARGSGSNATVRVLATLEKQGEAGAQELVGYLDHDDPIVVARAAWGLGNLRHTAALPRLVELVGNAESPEVRKHAMRALMAMEDPRSVQVSIQALKDDDAELRCFAAANLIRFGHGEATNALVSVLARTTTEEEGDRDAIAALLTLTELGNPEELLAAATAFARTSPPACEALVWMFQQLSPELESKDESTLLMAILDHDVVLLRRYSIQRLGELADPRTAAALEARLVSERDELRPLIEVSLAAVHGAGPDGGGSGGVLADRARDLLARAEQLWQNEDTRTIALSGAAGLLTLLLTSTFLIRRARRQREADNWAEMTRPSDDFEQPRMVNGRPRYEDYEPDAELEQTDVEDVEWNGDEVIEEQEAEWEPDDSPRV